MNFVARLPAHVTGITLWGASLALGLVACSKNAVPESTPAATAPAAGAPGAPTGTTGTPAVAPATGSAPAAPAPVVSVVTVKVEKRDVPVVLKAVGSAISLASVDIRPQVTSAITQVHFKEGQFVNKGDVHPGHPHR